MADDGATRTVPGLDVVKAAAWAMGIAMVVNGGLYLIGDALGAFPADAVAPGQGGPVTLGPVLALSAAGSAVGVGVFTILRLFTDKAWTVFLGIAVAVFLIMAVPPFQIQDVPVAQIVLLETMHLVTAVATIGAVARIR